jgi:hypothetical protein
MRNIVLAMVAGVGMLMVTSLQASAIPANGAAIAHLGKQVDPLINVKHKKKKAQAAADTAAKPACPADQTRSNKSGGCVPLKSER